MNARIPALLALAAGLPGCLLLTPEPAATIGFKINRDQATVTTIDFTLTQLEGEVDDVALTMGQGHPTSYKDLWPGTWSMSCQAKDANGNAIGDPIVSEDILLVDKDRGTCTCDTISGTFTCTLEENDGLLGID